jgi:hypothetical protein
MGRTTANIDQDALARLNELKRLVKAEFGLKARQEDILSALLLDASPGHVAGTLLAFEKARPDAEDASPEASKGGSDT